jgi:hypothetical protein
MPNERIFRVQAESAERGVLSMWTVYDHPRDFPHSYVARRFEVGQDGAHPTEDFIQGDLAIIRKSFSQCGLVCLTRDESDEPQIMETWL